MYKQIIIVRKDLGMSNGKLASQISHASMAFLTNMIRENAHKVEDYMYQATSLNHYSEKVPRLYQRHDLYHWAKEAFARGEDVFYAKPVEPSNPKGKLELCEPTSHYDVNLKIDNDLYEQWINGIFTKCVLGAKNKNQLMKAKTMAESMGMVEGKDFFLIKDCCLTELEPEEVDENGVVRTLTCIGFRPMDTEIIDQIGKKYQLY